MKRLGLFAGLLLVRFAALAQGAIDFTSTPVSGVTADALAAGPDGSLWSVSGAASRSSIGPVS